MNISLLKNYLWGTSNLLAHTFTQYGITTTFVDAHNLQEVEDAIQENTKAIYLETLGNPNSDIPDIDAISAIAKNMDYQLLLIIHLVHHIYLDQLNMVLISLFIVLLNLLAVMVQA